MGEPESILDSKPGLGAASVAAEDTSGTIRSLRRALVAAARIGGARRLVLQLALSGAITIVEVASLASLVPLVLLLTSPGRTPTWLSEAQALLGVASRNEVLITLVAVLFLVFLAKNVLQVIIVYLQHRYAFALANRVCRWTVDRVLSGSFEQLSNQDTGRLWHHILTIPGTFASAVVLSLFYLVGEVCVLSLITLALALYDPRVFGLLAISVGPPAFLGYKLVKNRMAVLGRQHGNLVPLANRRILPILQGYLEIKLGLKSRFFTDRLMDQVAQINANLARTETLHYVPYRLVETTVVSAILSIVILQQLTEGDPSRLGAILAIYATGAFRLLPSLNRTVTSVMRIRNAEHVLDVVETEIRLHRASGTPAHIPGSPARFEQTIAFEKICYSYPNSAEPTLKDATFELTKGSCIGIRGPSGSGKTTLLRLILGLLEPQSGRINVDGVAFSRTDLQPWWLLLGYVPQEVYILDGTISENVAFGESVLDRAQIEHALALAGLGPLVQSLPLGIDTSLAAMGSRFSGGQRQRVGIARALYRDAQVFLFDEITSALDPATEGEVLESIAHLKSERKTVVIISHRDSTLIHCDVIYTLNEGRLAKQQRPTCQHP